MKLLDVVIGAGTPASTTAILNELEAAVRLAPRWPEALFSLAQAQHSLGKLEESLTTLRLYKLADPDGRVSASRNPDPETERTAARAMPPDDGPSSGRDTLTLYCHKFRGPDRPKVKCDDARFADLGKERVVEISAEAGLHKVRVHNKDLSVRILPGTTHYVRAKVVGFPAHFEIEEVSADVAIAEMRTLKILPNEVEKTYSGTCGVGK